MLAGAYGRCPCETSERGRAPTSYPLPASGCRGTSSPPWSSTVWSLSSHCSRPARNRSAVSMALLNIRASLFGANACIVGVRGVAEAWRGRRAVMGLLVEPPASRARASGQEPSHIATNTPRSSSVHHRRCIHHHHRLHSPALSVALQGDRRCHPQQHQRLFAWPRSPFRILSWSRSLSEAISLRLGLGNDRGGDAVTCAFGRQTRGRAAVGSRVHCQAQCTDHPRSIHGSNFERLSSMPGRHIRRKSIWRKQTLQACRLIHAADFTLYLGMRGDGHENSQAASIFKGSNYS
jgi:hypothetical protein